MSTSAPPRQRFQHADDRLFVYRLDADDRIVAVNAAWSAFARENETAALPDSVVGSAIWRYIADATTRHIYRQLFEQVRARRQQVRIPFRCDAPALVREMELEIGPEPDGGLTIRSRIVAERARPAIPLLDPTLSRSGDMLRMCGWCKRVALDDAWHELEDAVTMQRLFHQPNMPEISHGICDRCETAMLALLEGDEFPR